MRYAHPQNSWRDLSTGSGVERAIREADFVCAVVVQGAQSGNVLFELGLARGIGRPLFVIVDDLAALPVELREVSVVRAKLSELEAIEFHLDAFLQHALKSPRGSRHVSSPRSAERVQWSDNALAQLKGLPPAERGFRLEDFVAHLFEQAGAVVSRNERPQADQGLDMVVWLDALEPVMANPLMVEVKAGRIEEAHLRSAEAQIRRYFEKVPAGAGMVVYHDWSGTDHPRDNVAAPNVMRFSVRQLARLVQAGELAAEIIRQRNRASHG